MVFCLSIGSLGDTSAVEVINWRSYEEGLVVSKVEKKKGFFALLRGLVCLLRENGQRYISESCHYFLP